MKISAVILGLGLIVGSGGCRATGGGLPEREAKAAQDSPEVAGTVRHVEMEGGFYGIVTDDGLRLDPVNLPAPFQEEGVRVRAYVQWLGDQASTRMWGRPVRIYDIERLGRAE